jgi:hypothetical protein
MARRLAASMALVSFAVSILVGLQAGNPFTTIVSKALLALVVTFVIGLVVGVAAQKMLDENLAATTASAAGAVKNSENPVSSGGENAGR